MATQPPQTGAALKSKRIGLPSRAARPWASVKVCHAIFSATAAMVHCLSPVMKSRNIADLASGNGMHATDTARQAGSVKPNGMHGTCLHVQVSLAHGRRRRGNALQGGPGQLLVPDLHRRIAQRNDSNK